MAEDVLKKTCLFDTAPKRPPKQGHVHSMISSENTFLRRNSSTSETSKIIDEITLDDDDEEDESRTRVICQYCPRDMTLWTKTRRETHTNDCRKNRNLAEKGRNFTETISRTTAKTKKIESIDDFVRKVDDNDDAEKSEIVSKKWEMSKEMVKFSKIDTEEEANRRRKRPRSFAVVELAPRECQCDILSALQTRFLSKFRKIKENENKENHLKNMTENGLQLRKIITKLSRLEQLSEDLRRMMEEMNKISNNLKGNEEFVTLKCLDGELRCLKRVLKFRTSALTKIVGKSDEIIVEMGQTKEIVKNWLAFVYSAQIEWGEDEKAGVLDLAQKYGPMGLEKVLAELEGNQVWRNERPKVVEESLEIRVEENGVEEIPHCEIEPETLQKFEDEEEEVEQLAEIQAEIFSEDPLDGFKNRKIDNETIQSPNVVESIEKRSDSSFETPISRRKSMGRKSAGMEKTFSAIKNVTENSVEDSFENFLPQAHEQPSTSNFQPLDPEESDTNMDSFDCFTLSNGIVIKTPETRSIKKLKFGSNVRIIKTTNITPMPDFEKMDKNELDEKMKEIGQRPRGKKKNIDILKRVYEEMHPAIVPDTPTLRPLPKSPSKQENQKNVQKRPKLAERFISPAKTSKASECVEEQVEQDDADKTLNDEVDIGHLRGNVELLDEDEDTEDAEECSQVRKSKKFDLEVMKTVFLKWIRKDENIELYNHILSLNPVSLEEMLVRLGKAEGPLSIIGKSKLAQVLDSLSVTYQLPQKGAGIRRIQKR